MLTELLRRPASGCYNRSMQYRSYHDLLTEEFERRKQLNTSYSMRAYARDLGMSAPRLSQVMSKKTGISVEAAEALAQKLKLQDDKKKWFCHSVGALHARSTKEKNDFKEKILEYKEEAKRFSELHLEYFKVIADWFHFAILELTYLQDFQNDYDWMAAKLGITSAEVQCAVERMKALDLIKEENGKLIDSFKFLATPSDVPSIALRKYNTQLMKKAIEALHEQDVSQREVSSNIFSIDKEMIPAFKDKIRSFRRELEQEASQSKKKNAVYCLGMQFHELTKGQE